MATFRIEPDSHWNENRLTVAPDWVPGADENTYFVSTTGSSGTMGVCHYDEYDLKQMIGYLSKKITCKYESSFFKNILFELYSLLKSGGSFSKLFDYEIENLTYLIRTFQPDNLLSKKINYYLPPTKAFKEKSRILYLLISLQHIICEMSGRLELRIPTVQKLAKS